MRYGLKCEVCGSTDDVVVCASIFGPISVGYCKECLSKGTEPYGLMVHSTACAGVFPDDISDEYRTVIRYNLKLLNISEEQFIKDVNQEIADEFE